MKHLAFDGNTPTNYTSKLYEINTSEYLKRRLKFWVYKKHQTMGRPILVRRGIWGRPN